MEKIILIGGGGHCNSVIDVIEEQGQFEIAGIIDRGLPVGDTVLGYEVLGADEDLKMFSDLARYALVTVGQIESPELKIRLFEMLKGSGFTLPVIVSPMAHVSKHAQVGEGSVIMHDALVNANARVGKNCIINTKALIEHDSVIGDHCHVSTGAIVNGGVYVEDKCFIGSNAVTSHATKITEGTFVKAGALVR